MGKKKNVMTMLFTHYSINKNIPQVHLPQSTKSQVPVNPFSTYEKRQPIDFNDYTKTNIFKNVERGAEFSVAQNLCVPVPRKATQTYMNRRDIKKSLNYSMCLKFLKLKQRNISSTKEAFEHVEKDLNKNFDKLISIYEGIEKTKAIKKQSRLPRFNKASKAKVYASKNTTPTTIGTPIKVADD